MAGKAPAPTMERLWLLAGLGTGVLLSAAAGGIFLVFSRWTPS